MRGDRHGGDVSRVGGTADSNEKLNEKSMMCLTCLVAPGVDSVSWELGLVRRHLTQSGDRDDDKPRVFADYGYLSGVSTPLFVARDQNPLA